MEPAPKRQATINSRQAAIDKALATPFNPRLSAGRVAYLLNHEYATLLRAYDNNRASLWTLPEFSSDVDAINAIDRRALKLAKMELRIQTFISLTPPDEIAHMRWGEMPARKTLVPRD
jgi:hypothetical protein